MNPKYKSGGTPAKPQEPVDRFQALFYPGTETLINNYGVKDPVRLKEIEEWSSGGRLARIRLLGAPKGNFDIEHLQKIHKEIFGDVYPWAGQLRDFPLYKRRDDGLTTVFAHPREFATNEREIREILDATANLSKLDRKEFVEQIARIYQINNEMHPFREGNGRTHRVYLNALAKEAGHVLDFSKVEKQAWNYAASKSAHVSLGNGDRIQGQIKELVRVFDHISRPRQGPALTAYQRGREGQQAVTQQRQLLLADLNPNVAASGPKGPYRRK